MKLKHSKIATLAATLITFGSLAGGANAALLLYFDDSSGNTVVTLTSTNLNLVGLTSSAAGTSSSTFISPSQGRLSYTGPADVMTAHSTYYEIPAFSYGSGGANSAAFNLGASNPYFAIYGDGQNLFPGSGTIILFDGFETDADSDFVATMTYAGTYDDLGINTTPQVITFSNGETLTIGFNVPEPSSVVLLGLGTLGLITRRKR